VTFRARLVIAATTAVTIAVLLACIAAWIFSRNSLVSSVDDTLFQTAQGIVNQPVVSYQDGNGALVQVTGPHGSILLSTTTPALPVSRIVKAYANGGAAGYTFATVNYENQNYREIIVSLPSGQVVSTGAGEGFVPPSAALQLAQPLGGVQHQLRHLGFILLLIGAAGVLIAVLLGLLVARAVIAPLNKVTESVEELAKTTDVSQRLDEGSNDELGRLRVAFNRLLSALERSQSQQQQLVLDASHELRTPLTSLRTNAEVLKRVDELDAEARTQLLDDVITQITELTTLIGDLTELARGEQHAAVPARFRLDQLVDDLVNVASTYGRTRQVDLELTSQPCWVFAERERVSRAIGNLINNAIKWSPEGGTVTIDVNDGVVVVDDEGPGIAEEDLTKVFDRFYRAPSARSLPGSGLGLAIVAQVVAEEGGSVAAARSPRGGARLTFRLPTVA
jgi:two-component system, OmpR family, sensor histidine kinase MprB